MPILKNKYQSLCDEKLMVFIQQGDTTAFNEIYNRYSQRILFYFFRMLGGNNERAQDLLQDLFLKVIEKKNNLHSIKNFSCWIFTIAHNMVKNEYRANKTRNVVATNSNLDSFAEDDSNQLIHSEKSLEKKLFKEAINSELLKMDETKRSTFVLKFQEGFSIREISDILNCSQGTIKSRLFYMTKNLAKKLEAFNPNTVKV